MYLSSIRLDEKRRKTLDALNNPGIVHGLVERCFCQEEERARRLWRIDRFGETYRLLLLSETIPDLSPIASQLGFENDVGETKDYTGLLNRIEAGQTWRFRIRANPVQSEKAPGKTRGRIRAHVTVEQQKRWLMKCSERFGFALEYDQFDVVHTKWERFKKRIDDRRYVVFRTVTFEGSLRVTDGELFCNALEGGIGREKGFGCGLLTIMRT
ncbi:MAG: type I-E CRISPR-associated protein Cas6/Cse3/CasE [Clostridia bacterium]|nr:type I-E CRISPR-associated protein Cas6/Cse3/CasE [Clostridia bacterium]